MRRFEPPAQNEINFATPNYLFGNRSLQKRKSLALQPRPGQKNVHWSPNLVDLQENGNGDRLETTASTASSLHRRATITGAPSWNAPQSSLIKGPPLRSMIYEEPSVKKQKVDKEVEIKEAFQFQGSSDDPADYWVTVFGFGPEDRDTVLALFARHANIVSHKIPEQGNWVHLRYSSVLHAQQAIKRSGNVLGSKVKIGVERCTDQDVLTDDTQTPLNINTSAIPEVSFEASNRINDSFNSTRLSMNQSLNSSINRSRLSTLSRAGMRRATMEPDTASLNSVNVRDRSIFNKIWNFVAPQ